MDWLIGLWLLHGGASVGAVPEAGSPAIEVATPRRPLAKRSLRSPSAVSGGVPRHRLVVKFVDDARMGLDAGRLASRSGRGVERLLALAERLGLGFTPLVPWSEARLSAVADRAHARSGRQQPDFGGMFVVVAPEGGTDLAQVGEALQRLEVVETAWVEILDVPSPADLEPPTANLVDGQDYWLPAPGHDLQTLWNMGLTGGGIRLADVETNWDYDHEEFQDVDLHPEPGQTPIVQEDFPGDHGVAVLGITSAPSNGYGIDGAVPDAWVHTYTGESMQDGARRPAAILAALEQSEPGDVIMLEIQTYQGGEPDGAPGEWDPAVWMATRMAVDAGVVVVAAAGNGGLDLDGPEFAEYRDRGDSGAILVGASMPDTREPADFSNFGARVDVHGWGVEVFTTGYGDYAMYGDDPRQSYTAGFNGTSAATPMVVSVAVALQDLSLEIDGAPMAPDELRGLLIETGLPQGEGGHIGPLPDPRAIVRQLLTEEAQAPSLVVTSPVDGTYIDAESYQTPITIEASDDSFLVESVQITINGALQTVIDERRPFDFASVDFPAGEWEIVAQGRDLWGNVGVSSPVRLYVGVEPPGASTGTADTSGAASSEGDATGDSTATDDGLGTTGEPSASNDGEAGGCGCDAGRPADAAPLVLLVGAWRRRR